MARDKQVAKKTEAAPRKVARVRPQASKVKGSGADAVPKKGAAAPKKERKPHRYRSGTVALRQVHKEQKSRKLAIPKTPFQRIVREKLHDITGADQDVRVSAECLQVFQAAVEPYLIHKIELAAKN